MHQKRDKCYDVKEKDGGKLWHLFDIAAYLGPSPSLNVSLQHPCHQDNLWSSFQHQRKRGYSRQEKHGCKIFLRHEPGTAPLSLVEVFCLSEYHIRFQLPSLKDVYVKIELLCGLSLEN